MARINAASLLAAGIVALFFALIACLGTLILSPAIATRYTMRRLLSITIRTPATLFNSLKKSRS
jgi:hypothetical protein